MNLLKSYEYFKPEMCKQRIHIIGCGSVGSTLAENLARLGLTKFSLYDFDKVEEKNIANQMFYSQQIGKLKTEAVADIICAINPQIREELQLFNEGYSNQNLSGYVFLCPDSIELRKEIVQKQKMNNFIKAMFDFRTRLEDAQHYAADWIDKKSVENFLKSMDFSDEEAKEATQVSACGTELSVAPTIRSIVAAGVANFMNFVKGSPIKSIILINSFTFDITTM